MMSPRAPFTRLGHNLGIASDMLRSSKTRSGLTILGVVIGVATVMSMAAIVQGIRDQILHTIEVAGPTTFYVMKFFSQTPLNPEQLPKEVRVRPDLTPHEAERIQDLPEVEYAAIWAQLFGRVEYQGARTQQITFFAADDRYSTVQGGDLARGRWFSRAELRSGASVAVLDESVAHTVFRRIDPLGRTVRIQGRPATVIGIYQPPANIFSPPGQKIGAVVPFRMADHEYRIDKTNALWIVVKPRAGVHVETAEAAVIVLMRRMRNLHPAQPNTFDLITQDQILGIFRKFTSAFFLVMIALSAVALLVGGIGVVAIDDGVGDEPHAGDRVAQGGGGHARGHPAAVSGGGGGTHRHGRRDRHRRRPARRRRHHPATRRVGHHAVYVYGGRRGGVRDDRDRVRALPGRAGGATRSGGSAAARIAPSAPLLPLAPFPQAVHLSRMTHVDVLAIAAHRDDVELTCAGTMLRAVRLGRTTAIVDLTQGELGTRGSAELRAEEASRAAAVLGVEARLNLGLPDGGVANTPQVRAELALVIRRFTPRVVIAPSPQGRHPDHRVAAELVRDACFVAGLRRIAPEVPPHRPHKVVHCITYQEHFSKPTFVVDISDVMEQKLQAIACYASQFDGVAQAGEVYPNGEPLLDIIRQQAAHYGSLIRTRYGEPFFTRETMRVDDVAALDVSTF